MTRSQEAVTAFREKQRGLSDTIRQISQELADIALALINLELCLRPPSSKKATRKRPRKRKGVKK